jgi:hypothetical protein
MILAGLILLLQLQFAYLPYALGILAITSGVLIALEK